MPRPIIILAIICFTSCQSGGNNQTTSATANNKKQIEAGLKFLNDYVKAVIKSKLQVNTVDWVSANRLASNRLKIELKRITDEAWKKYPVTGLDADPIFDAQYFPQQGFEFDSADRDNAYLFFKGRDIPQFKLALKMVEQDGKWLVDGCGIVNIPEDKRPKR